MPSSSLTRCYATDNPMVEEFKSIPSVKQPDKESRPFRGICSCAEQSRLWPPLLCTPFQTVASRAKPAVRSRTASKRALTSCTRPNLSDAVGSAGSEQGLRFSTVSPLNVEDGDEQRGGKFPRVLTMPKSLWSADHYT